MTTSPLQNVRTWDTCPPWCTLAGSVEHLVDAELVDGERAQWHDAPCDFGPHVMVSALERGAGPLGFTVMVDAELTHGGDARSVVGQVAALRDALAAAAEWIEARA